MPDVAYVCVVRHMMLSVAWSNPSVVAALSALVAFITTILSTPVRYMLDKRALQHKLHTEYEYEQRRELRQLIGRYHGRLVDAADSWHNRMENLYKHVSGGRLDVNGAYEHADYYFTTTVYRFLVLASLARAFEGEAFFIDARIAEKNDLDFVRFVKAFRWLMTDLGLIEGLEYDPWLARDHLLTDRFRVICDSCSVDGNVFSMTDFEQRAGKDPDLEPALEFFDGLRPDEDRLRWDRLVAFHLAVMAFLNLVGYDVQGSSDEDFVRVAGHIRHPQVRANLAVALGRLGLAANDEGLRLAQALGQHASVEAGRTSVPALASR
jgi:hypothetical protein